MSVKQKLITMYSMPIQKVKQEFLKLTKIIRQFCCIDFVLQYVNLSVIRHTVFIRFYGFKFQNLVLIM